MGTLVCPLCCGHTFSNSQSLRYHLLSVTDNVICPGCDERFDSVLSLADHLNENCGKHDTEDEEMEIADDRDESRSPENLLSENQNTISPVHDIQVNSDSSKSLHDNETSDTLVALQGKDESTSPKHSTTKKMKPEASGVLPSLVSDRNESSESVVVSANQEDDVEEYSCSTCQITFSSVAEHIEEYHLAQDIVVEMNLGSKAAGNHEHVNELIKTLQVDKETASESKEVSTNQFNVLGSSILIQAASTDSTIPTFLVNSGSVGPNCSENSVVTTPLQFVCQVVPSSVVNQCNGTSAELAATSLMQPVLVPYMAPLCETPSTSQVKLLDATAESPLSKVTRKRNKSSVELEKDRSDVTIPCAGAVSSTDSKKKIIQPVSVECERKIVQINKFWEDTQFKPNIIKETKKKEEREVSKLTEDRKHPGGCIATVRTLVGPGELCKKDVYECNKCIRQFSSMGRFLGHKCLTCKECGILFKEMPTLKDHMAMEHNIGSFTCDICKAKFSSVYNLRMHICRFCEECGITFSRMKGLQKHIKVVHEGVVEENKKVKKEPEGPATCEVCDTIFPTVRRYKLHRKMHYARFVEKYSKPRTSTEYKCEVCSTYCSSKRTLTQHMTVHSGIAPKTPAKLKAMKCPLVCKVCDKSFEFNEELKQHWKEHVSNNEDKKKKTDTVSKEKDEDKGKQTETVSKEKDEGKGKKTETVSKEKDEDKGKKTETVSKEKDEDKGEKTETVSKEDKVEEKFTCDICDNTFDKSYQTVHMSTHSSEKLFPCDVCNKKFYKRNSLAIHKRMHTGKRPHVCVHCKQHFQNSDALKVHLVIHAGERLYVCGFCGQRFSKPHAKVKHERIHTGEKPHVCTICGMKFRVGQCLTLHMRVHTGIKPYKCTVCEKQFRTQNSFTQHSKLHSEVRSYHCTLCPKSYKTSVQLFSHKQRHTKPFVCSECPRQFACLSMVKKHIAIHSSLKFRCDVCGICYSKAYTLKKHIKTHVTDSEKLAK